MRKTATTKAFKKIKTLDDACKIMGVDAKKLDRTRPKILRPYKKLKVIADAINKETRPDLTGHVPYFQDEQNYKFGNNTLQVGSSSILFATGEMAQYAAKQFKDIYA